MRESDLGDAVVEIVKGHVEPTEREWVEVGILKLEAQLHGREEVIPLSALRRGAWAEQVDGKH